MSCIYLPLKRVSHTLMLLLYCNRSAQPVHRPQVPLWSLPVQCHAVGVGGIHAEVHAHQSQCDKTAQLCLLLLYFFRSLTENLDSYL